jgi:hypothetical protein
MRLLKEPVEPVLEHFSSVFLLGSTSENAINNRQAPRQHIRTKKLHEVLFAEMPGSIFPSCNSSCHRNWTSKNTAARTRQI